MILELCDLLPALIGYMFVIYWFSVHNLQDWVTDEQIQDHQLSLKDFVAVKNIHDDKILTDFAKMSHMQQKLVNSKPAKQEKSPQHLSPVFIVCKYIFMPQIFFHT
jgi:hypothetical protein